MGTGIMTDKERIKGLEARVLYFNIAALKAEDRVEELEEENKRMREALKRIAEDTLHKQFAIDTAKEALKEAEDGR